MGASRVQGEGPMTRRSRLIGRGRALGVRLRSDVIGGELAERYGYVDRSFADSELDAFVDALASRIASFDKESIVAIKRQVNLVTLPSDDLVAPEWDAFIASVGRPQAQERIAQLMQLGLQKNHDVEARLAHYTGTLGR